MSSSRPSVLRQAELSPLEVRPKGNEPIERLVRRFVRKTRDDGILREFRLRQSFMKPSQKRRRSKSLSRG